MKKFVSKVIWFLIGLVVLDVLVGLGARYLVGHAKGGDTGLNNYICHEMKDECIVFGSSRGMHHYDPNIIADSLGMLLELFARWQRHHPDVWAIQDAERTVHAQDAHLRCADIVRPFGERQS